MITLKINDKEVKVEKGSTILDAVRLLDIDIPTMCFHDKGFTNHPSCMVCVVMDKSSGNLLPSCAMPASEGMDILTDCPQVVEARKEALELLLSEHTGDCEAPCRTSCPAFMDIPKMNRYIASGNFHETIKIIKQEIAIPLVLGYICPAPCEKACRRASADKPVSICKLKGMVAIDDAPSPYLPESKPKSGKNVAVIGSGPAGLACAYHLVIEGYNCTIFDRNDNPGGTLRYSIPDDKLPKHILDKEINILNELGICFVNRTEVSQEFYEKKILPNYDAVVFACGNFNESNVSSFNFSFDKNGIIINKETFEVKKGVFACGNILRSRLMAVTSVAQGKAAAHSVSMFLSGEKPSSQQRKFNSKFGKLSISETEHYLKEGSDKKENLENAEFPHEISYEEAIKEAERCMHCDCRKSETCKLRNLSTQYNPNRRKYGFSSRREYSKNTDNKLIIFEPSKCISCNICVEICEQIKDDVGFTSINRGFNIEIALPPNESLKNILDTTAYKCAQDCPTGAISLR